MMHDIVGDRCVVSRIFLLEEKWDKARTRSLFSFRSFSTFQGCWWVNMIRADKGGMFQSNERNTCIQICLSLSLSRHIFVSSLTFARRACYAKKKRERVYHQIKDRDRSKATFSPRRSDVFDQLVVKRSGHLFSLSASSKGNTFSLSLPLSLDLICVSHRADVQHTHIRVHILLHLKVNEKLRCVYMCVLLTEWDKKGVSKHSNRSSKNTRRKKMIIWTAECIIALK